MYEELSCQQSQSAVLGLNRACDSSQSQRPFHCTSHLPVNGLKWTTATRLTSDLPIIAQVSNDGVQSLH